MGDINTDIYSQLTNIIVTKGKLDHNMTFDVIKEYLIYNMDAFNRFAYGIKDDNGIKGCIFRFDYTADKPYDLWQNIDTGEIHYLLENNEFILETIEKKKRVSHFNMSTSDEWGFKKEVINPEYSIYESYYPGKKIETTIYSTQNLYNAIKEIKYDYLTSGSDSFVNYPMVCVKDNGERKIIVEETNSIKLEKDYLITIKGSNDEIFLRKVVNGSSLYSVYYNLMIEYRFFKNQENRISK